MRLEFSGIKQHNGNVTEMTARVDGKVYSYRHVIEPKDEPFRKGIEEHMFLSIFREIFHNEVKT